MDFFSWSPRALSAGAGPGGAAGVGLPCVLAPRPPLPFDYLQRPLRPPTCYRRTPPDFALRCLLREMTERILGRGGVEVGQVQVRVRGGRQAGVSGRGGWAVRLRTPSSCSRFKELLAASGQVGTMRTPGVLTPSLEGLLPPQLLTGVQLYLGRAGWKVLWVELCPPKDMWKS